MGAEYKKLIQISYVTDTDVGYYEMGEVSGIFQKQQLKEYIKRYGPEKLQGKLSFLNYQIYECIMELNDEKENNSAKNTTNMPGHRNPPPPPPPREIHISGKSRTKKN